MADTGQSHVYFGDQDSRPLLVDVAPEVVREGLVTARKEGQLCSLLSYGEQVLVNPDRVTFVEKVHTGGSAF
jgi:hypothetical protein